MAVSESIRVVITDIVDMDVDAIVNAANENLWHGGGVCGAIFDAAGPREMAAACDEIGHCDTGDAVMTPGFALAADYVIHAVGPRWQGGRSGEAELLASCYVRALDLAAQAGCTSIAFPLISSGIFGYPVREAWRVALTTCDGWLREHDDARMDIVFCVLSVDSFALALDAIDEL